jgi:predicted PurR-regulated permease PerM
MDETATPANTTAEQAPEATPQPDMSDLAELISAPGARSAALTGLFVLVVFYTLYFTRELVLPIVLAMLLNFLLGPLVRHAKRYLHIPEPLGAALVVLALLAGVGYGVYALTGPAADWVARAPQSMAQIQYKLRVLRESVAQVQETAKQVERMTEPDGPSAPKVVVQGRSILGTIVSQAQSFLASLLVVITLVYFLLAAGDMFLLKLVKVLPNLAEKKRAVEIFRRVEDDVSSYLLTVTMINAGLGAVTALALHLLGMPNPALWGAMVGILNFIPYLGAAVNFVVLAAAALLAFDDFAHALSVPLVFLVLTSLEGQFITPMILGRRLTLSPVVIFVGLIFWMWMWGILGALLAVPILAVIKIFCDSFESLAPIGEFMGR